jgi:phosphoserine phosphatase
MRVRVEVPEPTMKSRSRNVNRAVRAVLTVQAMKRALVEAMTAQTQAMAALTGGQKAEAERILRETGASPTFAEKPSEPTAHALGNKP